MAAKLFCREIQRQQIGAGIVLQPSQCMRFFKKTRLKSLTGFTLIELLVVIAIIGLLSSIVLVNMKDSRAKARDAKRVQELEQLKTAMLLYYDKYETYPANTDSGDAGCWWFWDAGNLINGPNDAFIKPLEDEGLIKTPREWTNMTDGWGSQCSYRYARQDFSICGCTQKYAVLYTALETNSTPPAREDERPDCIKSCWGEGGAGYDYAIYLPY